jgi:crotonobetainyl-CoA:carnitine CoA-transferase CaiB-like acyl-CoA transferase
VIGGANQTNWLRIVDAMGAPELAEDPRLQGERRPHGQSEGARGRTRARFRTQTAEYWLQALDAKGVPCGPVNDTLEALNDPQTAAREMVVEVEHSTIGPVKTMGLPVKFSATPGRCRIGAPLYGEHSRGILAEHGFSRKRSRASNGRRGDLRRPARRLCPSFRGFAQRRARTHHAGPVRSAFGSCA